MKIFQDMNSSINMIRSYEDGIIKINNDLYSKSLILTAENLMTDWPVQHIDQLSAESFTPIASLNIDVLLIGTGRQLHFPDIQVFEPLRNKNIGYEIMDTPAACRTYNIIVHDGRKVGAALIIE